jgi:hypothetical protein
VLHQNYIVLLGPLWKHQKDGKQSRKENPVKKKEENKERNYIIERY